MIPKSESSFVSSLDNHQKFDVFLEKMVEMVDQDNELQSHFKDEIVQRRTEILDRAAKVMNNHDIGQIDLDPELLE